MGDKRPVLFLPKTHLQAIGNLAAHWAYLEWIVEYAIWAALDVDDDQGRAITTHIGMVSRSQMLIMLTHQQYADNPKLCEPLEDLLGRIEKARVQRNDIIHYIWKYTKHGPTAVGVKFIAKGKLKANQRAMTAADIRAVTSEIFDVVMEMMYLLDAMFPNRTFPWQGKPPLPNRP